MNKVKLGALAGLLLASGAASAAVTVTFVAPEKYADVPPNAIERDRVLGDLRAHVEKLASTLPAGEDLDVQVLDLDMAGIIRPSPSRPDLRIVNGRADWPQMHIRYTLRQGGRVIRSGDDHLADMNYTGHINRYSNDASLRYEKQMIDDWFRSKVAAAG